MPTYEYKCKQCNHRFEAFHSMSERVESCPECSGGVERLISGGAGLIFKGSGFYKTDYKHGCCGTSDGGELPCAEKCPVAEKCAAANES